MEDDMGRKFFHEISAEKQKEILEICMNDEVLANDVMIMDSLDLFAKMGSVFPGNYLKGKKTAMRIIQIRIEEGENE